MTSAGTGFSGYGSGPYIYPLLSPTSDVGYRSKYHG